MYRELKCFIKPFTRLETSSTFPNNHKKNSAENSVFEFWSVERSFWLIECSFHSIEQESNSDRTIWKLQDYFSYYFDQSSQSFDRSKILIFEFSLRKFQKLNFLFMKPYSPNSNIIITTYPCIYLYIQHRVPYDSHWSPPLSFSLQFMAILDFSMYTLCLKNPHI